MLKFLVSFQFRTLLFHSLPKYFSLVQYRRYLDVTPTQGAKVSEGTIALGGSFTTRLVACTIKVLRS